jgi:hypothetical protein
VPDIGRDGGVPRERCTGGHALPRHGVYRSGTRVGDEEEGVGKESWALMGV